MERKVGDVFDYKGIKLQVNESHFSSCAGCFFNHHLFACDREYFVTGSCLCFMRTDDKNVIFVEVESDKNKEE